jgi:hypothetical protein
MTSTTIAAAAVAAVVLGLGTMIRYNSKYMHLYIHSGKSLSSCYHTVCVSIVQHNCKRTEHTHVMLHLLLLHCSLMVLSVASAVQAQLDCKALMVVCLALTPTLRYICYLCLSCLHYY